MLCTHTYHDIGRLIIQVVLPLEFLNDGFQQIWIAGHRCIVMERTVNRLFGSLPDMFGSHKIGFPHTEVDNVDSFVLQFTSLLIHGNSG